MTAGLRGISNASWERQRWFVIGSSIISLGVAVIIGASRPAPWNWFLFCWGLGFGVVGAIVQYNIMGVVGRLPEVTPEQRECAGSGRWVFMLCWVIYGAVLGALAAGFNRWWIDVVAMTFVTLCYLSGLRMALALIRKPCSESQVGEETGPRNQHRVTRPVHRPGRRSS